MKPLSDRPLLTGCAALCAAALFLRGFPSAVKLILAAAAVLGTAILVFLSLRRPSENRKTILLPFLPLFIGLAVGLFSSWSYFDLAAGRILARGGETGTITARITDISYRSETSSVFTAEVVSFRGEPARFRVLLTVSEECAAERGDYLTLTASLSVPPESENGFPARTYYASRGVFLFAESASDQPVALTAGKPTVTAFFSDLSERLTARFRLLLGRDKGGLAAGTLLGRRSAVPDNVKRDFRFLGLSHVLAVSGLHLTILTGGFLLLLRSLKVPPTARLILSILLILFFGFLTGFPASVVRAGVMLILLLLSRRLGSRYDPATALGFAAALLLTVSPGSALDVGFLLSASASLGMIVLGRPLSVSILQKAAKKRPVIRFFGKRLADMALTVSAVFFTLPVTAVCFGELSLLSPLTNLLFLPLIGLLLPLSILTVLTYGSFLTPIFAEITGDAAGLILWFSDRIADRSIEPICLPADLSAAALLTAAAGALLLFLYRVLIVARRNPPQNRLRPALLLTPVLLFVLVFGIGTAAGRAQTRNDVRLAAVNFGKNDYLLIAAGGKTLLCDMSDGSYTSLSRAASLSAEALGDASPDALLLTHWHRRYLSSVSRLADSCRLRCLILPTPYSDESAGWADTLSSLAVSRGIEVLFYDSADVSTVDFLDCRLTLSPIRFLPRSSQPLTTLAVEGNGRFLYLGSGTASDSEAVLSGADLVWFGVHGPVITEPLVGLPANQAIVSSQAVNDLLGTDLRTVSAADRPYVTVRFSADRGDG